MHTAMTQQQAYELLKQYNKDPFHLRHARTVEGTMRYFARELGYGEEEDFWGIVGLLHDLDSELYPEEHCIKSQELMKQAGLEDEVIHATASHGYGMCCDICPEHQMEKVLFATDELTGLIGAAALMRPSKSTKDMELKSLRINALLLVAPAKPVSRVQICWAGSWMNCYPEHWQPCRKSKMA